MMRWTYLLLVLIFLISGVFVTGVAQQWHAMTFRSDAPGIDANPLRGFVRYASEEQSSEVFPHSMEWFYLPLAAVVTGPDTYDWSALDQQLTAIAARGHQAIFRFYLDYPKKSTGIPKYLMAAGLKTFRYADSNNATSATPSVSPDYRDPRLIECMVQFIRAFGAKYDGDVRIAYLTAGLYGFWGEWHVHDHPFIGESQGWSIRQKDKDALLRAYVDSFHRTPVLVRYPDITQDRGLLAHFGFHDDSFLKDTIGTERSQFWSKMQVARTTRFWEEHPMGGEIYPALQTGLWGSWPNSAGQLVSDAVATTHATWMLDSALFETAPTPVERMNALRAERMLGYALYCQEWRVVRNKEGTATLTVQVENHGVAPIYYSWPIEVKALDGTGKIVGQGNAVWPLPALFPGKALEWSVSLNALPSKATTVVLRIANPMPGGHVVAFANAEMGTVLPGWLTFSLEASDQ
jgi:hypothetical protein